MKSKRTAACLAVLGALCVPAVAAAPASAALPEYGHCTEVKAGETGKFGGASCITLGTAKKPGKFEFKPIEATEGIEGGGVGSAVKVVTSGHPTLYCGSISIVPKWTGPKNALVKIILTECHNLIKQSCQSGTTSGDIEANPLEGELGIVKASPPLVGMDIKPQTPLTTLFSYSCGMSVETANVEGSVIARVKPIDKMTREQNTIIAAPLGAQFPQSFEGGPTDTLSTKYLPAGTTTPSTMSVSNFHGSVTALNGNPEVELKAIE